MKHLKILLTVAVVLAMTVGSVHAQSTLTTLFAANNQGSAGGAVYFDATVTNNNPLVVTGMTSNFLDPAGTVFNNFQVWVLPGSPGQGNESNGSPWQMVATGSGTTAGTDNPTTINLSNSFQLGLGLTGIALVADPAVQHTYTNGDGTNQNFTDGVLTLDLGSATNIPFTGGAFSPRVWNGSITYGKIPEPTAFAGLAIVGLIGLTRRRR